MATPDEQALNKIDAFAFDGSKGGVWLRIRKEELVLDLRERIRNKDGLNQEATGLCGPTALIHSQLQDDPVSFVTLAIDLYRAGRGTWRGQVVQANYSLLTSLPPDGLIVHGAAERFNRADWIVLASVRNSINPDELYSHWNSRGTTLFSDLLAFIRRLGYTAIYWSFSEDTVSADEHDARRASAFVKAGYRVLLNINDVMLYSSTQSDWGGERVFGLVPKPNHIVQLVSEIKIRPRGNENYADYTCRTDGVCKPTTPEWLGTVARRIYAVNFEVFTWAEGRRHVPQDPNKALSLNDFLWNFYGYIAFKN
jgi:hypothetical protein